MCDVADGVGGDAVVTGTAWYDVLCVVVDKLVVLLAPGTEAPSIVEACVSALGGSVTYKAGMHVFQASCSPDTSEGS